MTCHACFGAGLTLDGDGLAALNPDPTGSISVNLADCTCDVKARTSTLAEPSTGGDGLHRSATGVLWVDSPHTAIIAAMQDVGPVTVDPADTTGTVERQDQTLSWTNSTEFDALVSCTAEWPPVTFDAVNEVDLGVGTRAELDVTGGGASWDTTWERQARIAPGVSTLGPLGLLTTTTSGAYHMDPAVVPPGQTVTWRVRTRTVIAAGHPNARIVLGRLRGRILAWTYGPQQ